MDYPQQDLRVTKTHMALEKAMMDLMEEKDFQKITVNDICQAAMVSRSTFYLHFEDKYQLMKFCLQMEKNRLEQLGSEVDPRKFIQTFLSTVKSRSKGYRKLLAAEINKELLEMFESFFYQFFHDFLIKLEKQGTEIAGPIPLLAVYYSAGISGMIMSWIKNDFSYSVEEMAICQYNLISDILPD